MSQMQLVVPMAGFGERFRQAGYKTPKPLIDIDGQPMIAHILGQFGSIADPLLICNAEHLADPAYAMAAQLAQVSPQARIVGIPSHKLGPVHSTLAAADRIDDDRPVVVTYCDCVSVFDWAQLVDFIAQGDYDGVIPAYRGFHPHLRRSMFHAYIRESAGHVIDIQEKQPFTVDPINEYASSGIYYFASGALLKRACQAVVDQNISAVGEYFISLAYKPLLEQGRDIRIFEIPHFLNWGTPEDVSDYRSWHRAFASIVAPRPAAAQAGTLLMPMAGLGQRFAQRGITTIKPLIPVSGRPMAVQAALAMPRAERTIFVLRADTAGLGTLQASLREAFPQAEFHLLAAPTDGQARTCVHALADVDGNAPLTIMACDSAVTYSAARFHALMADADVDLVVWTARGLPCVDLTPGAYSWVEAEGDVCRSVSVKHPLNDPFHDPVVLGGFTFKRAADFVASAERIFSQERRVGGEFYVDACVNAAIEMGLKARIIEVDAFLNWGTPEDLDTFLYWQAGFHRWSGHPYDMMRDPMIPAGQRDAVIAGALGGQGRG
ncbi:NTP transferase domain-containing protein [Ferrovibrio terrae]|uniref:NTP transferase domain-containing protein n=1 Tax=Ferrovibrio terrae TaxID=2594003 RepID=UPI0031380AF4